MIDTQIPLISGYFDIHIANNHELYAGNSYQN
jgi:hypothetical protein